MRTLLIIVCLIFAPLATAQNEAYRASVPVPSQNAEHRDAALREALAQVLVRVSGDPAAGSAYAILDRAQQLVQQYGYEHDAQRQLNLVAAFDPRAVENALKAEGLPVWGVYAGSVEEVPVSISGIRSAADYARAMAAIGSLPGVKSVSVVEASRETLHLMVQNEGGAARLAGALSIGGVLMREMRDPASSDRLSYTLN